MAQGVVVTGTLYWLDWVSAALVAAALLVYGYRKDPKVVGGLKRQGIAVKWVVLFAAAIAITATGASGWWRYIRPVYMIVLPPLPAAPPDAVGTYVLPVASEREIALLERAAQSSLARNLITLFERDPESWPGHASDRTVLRLDEDIRPPLEMRVGQRQRFNPQLSVPLNADKLIDATVFLYFPIKAFGDPGAIERDPRWTPTEDRTGQNIIYYLKFGDVVKSYGGAPIRNAFYLTAKADGVFPVDYAITGQAETTDALPLRRSFRLTIKP